MIYLMLCVLAVVLAVANTAINLFWPGKWPDILPILSYLCPLPFTFHCFYDVADRVQAGDISGLLDIYPAITNGFILLYGTITVFNLAALLLKGKRRTTKLT